MMCASGYEHCLLLDTTGCVWGCGYNPSGELGLGPVGPHNATILTPQKIVNLPPIVSLSAGSNISFFLDANGNVWSCGCNYYGQLGLGDQKDRFFPEQIQDLPIIISTFALVASSIFLDCEGSVWTCGHNGHGELGLGDTTNRNKAEKIQGLPKIKSMAGGYSHSLFLDCEGSVWACGYNSDGNLGLGDTVKRIKAEKIQDVPAIKSMAGGVHFSMFVDEEGNVWVCGGNQHGELGVGHSDQINTPQKNNNLSGIVAVAAGNENYSVFLDNTGNIFTCGCEYGPLGLEGTGDRYIPHKVNNIPPMSCISCCNTAHFYSQIVDREGGVWGCGGNNYGQLGLGHANQTQTFQRIESCLFKLTENESSCQTLTNNSNYAYAGKKGFEEKLNTGQFARFTVDEVSLFLNVCGMQDLVTHQRQKKIDGAVLEAAIADVTVMEIKDKLTEKKMEFYLKVLQSGKMGNEQELNKSTVWRHREVEKTLVVMKEWDIELDENLVRKKGISICELLYFKAKDFQKELGMGVIEALLVVWKLKRVRKAFEAFLVKNE